MEGSKTIGKTVAEGCAFKGFSLLEVIVALAILALAFGTLFPAMASMVRNTELTEDYRHALTIAEARIATFDVLARANDLPVGQEGIVDERFRWRATVQEIEEWARKFDAQGVLPHFLTIEVHWERSGKEYSVSLNTVRLIGQQ